jgi:hypothetical protein
VRLRLDFWFPYLFVGRFRRFPKSRRGSMREKATGARHMTSQAASEQTIGEKMDKIIEQNARIIELLEGLWNQNDGFHQRYHENQNYARLVEIKK